MEFSSLFRLGEARVKAHARRAALKGQPLLAASFVHGCKDPFSQRQIMALVRVALEPCADVLVQKFYGLGCLLLAIGSPQLLQLGIREPDIAAFAVWFFGWRRGR